MEDSNFKVLGTLGKNNEPEFELNCSEFFYKSRKGKAKVILICQVKDGEPKIGSPITLEMPDGRQIKEKIQQMQIKHINVISALPDQAIGVCLSNTSYAYLQKFNNPVSTPAPAKAGNAY